MTRFRNKGINDRGDYTYIRAGNVEMKVSDKNGKRVEEYDQSKYEVAVNGVGKLIKSPCCEGDIVYVDGKYRCLDCEKELEVSELKRKVACNTIDHMIIDGTSRYAEKQIIESWNEIRLGLEKRREIKRCVFTANNHLKFIKMINDNTILVGIDKVEPYSAKFYFFSENMGEELSKVIQEEIGVEYNIEFVALGI